VNRAKWGLLGMAVLASMSVFIAACGGSTPAARMSTQGSGVCATTGQTAADAYDETGSATLTASYSSTAADVASWEVNRIPSQPGAVSTSISSLAANTPVAVCYYSGEFGSFPEPPQVPGATPLPQPYYHYLILDVAGTAVIVDSVGPTPFSFGPPEVVTPSPAASTSPSTTPSTTTVPPAPNSVSPEPTASPDPAPAATPS
jgi:hypothetical protein